MGTSYNMIETIYNIMGNGNKSAPQIVLISKPYIISINQLVRSAVDMIWYVRSLILLRRI